MLEVAPRLLGATLRHGEVSLRVTEVEAYDGPNDPGSHAYRGRTARNAVMFGPPAHLYVYFTYGMHHCCNVVVGPEGTPSAVLLRAGEVVDGRDVARARRPRSRERDLARGPARLCRGTRHHPRPGRRRPHVRASSRWCLGEPVDGVGTGPRVGLRGAPDGPGGTGSRGSRASPRTARPRPSGGVADPIWEPLEPLLMWLSHDGPRGRLPP